MGFTSIACCDRDWVEDSNRNRQFFKRRDVGKPKAHAVLRNVRPFATAACELVGFFGTFQEFRLSGDFKEHDIVFCGVDNDEANTEVARYGAAKGIPVVFVNVSRDGEAFRIFIQRPGEACFSCYRPATAQPEKLVEARDLACTPDPAVGDCLMAAVSFACRALVLEVCGQRISKTWNCRDITFYGLDLKEMVQRKSDCALCRKAA